MLRPTIIASPVAYAEHFSAGKTRNHGVRSCNQITESDLAITHSYDSVPLINKTVMGSDLSITHFSNFVARLDIQGANHRLCAPPALGCGTARPDPIPPPYFRTRSACHVLSSSSFAKRYFGEIITLTVSADFSSALTLALSFLTAAS